VKAGVILELMYLRGTGAEARLFCNLSAGLKGPLFHGSGYK